MKLLSTTILGMLRTAGGKKRSQTDMAKLAEVSLRTYQNWESGVSNVPLHKYVQLCVKLSVEPSQLIPSLSALVRGGEQAGIEEIDKVDQTKHE
ncbi:helix-turn-helix transcriptional regulator [Pseudoalteromonas sp. JBTF-M23]|uniref:Helix-turn-helix transcriptional regulator n=1 Tax=Pseudoalteromonas caenipelagi TaxID=2726988 RepID=A0A849V9H2_9GAMM|nr:helix-turn-helix transcriptional regulator [Pseudoalteromonas caenipelagi]NOU49992.1 helix-turn-helix transcriptional regulator [Pseudoalteromonas caenipelagi]